MDLSGSHPRRSGLRGGQAGGSAHEAFLVSRRRRRRMAATSTVLLVLGIALGICASGSTAAVVGPSLLVAGLLVVAGLLGCLIAWKGGPDPTRWLQGASAERVTAALLSKLPARRWSVWHDLRIPGSRANIDHVVIGPTGVWVVDTKSTRAPVRARWRSVRFGDRSLDTASTRWEARVVSDRLDVRVRPIVAVHGVGLRRRGGRAGGVRVVPADQLVRRLRHGRRRLDRSDVEDLTEQLVNHFHIHDDATVRG